MPITLEPDIIERDLDLEWQTPVEMPPIFGKCPVCKKPLKPRCKVTGEPKAPPVGTGFESRAKCDRCGTIICYIGNGEWRVLTDADLDEDDQFADKMGF